MGNYVFGHALGQCWFPLFPSFPIHLSYYSHLILLVFSVPPFWFRTHFVPPTGQSYIVYPLCKNEYEGGGLCVGIGLMVVVVVAVGGEGIPPTSRPKWSTRKEMEVYWNQLSVTANKHEDTK